MTVYEKEAAAGGQYRIAAVPPMKQDLSKTIAAYLAFCRKYQVKIHYNVKADRALLEQGNFDEIILACGALPVIPRIDGISEENVCLANDVLRFQAQIQNQRVIVLGAGLVGVETAEVLAGFGNEVTVVDMLEKPAPLAPARPRENLLSHMRELGVTFIMGSRVTRIHADGISCEKNGEQLRLEGFDRVAVDGSVSYSHILFYDRTPQLEFAATVEYANYPAPYLSAASFGRYTFGVDPNNLDPNTAYLISASSSDPFRQAGYTVEEFGLYSVAVTEGLSPFR